MSVIERRVFYGKPGRADAIVGICKEFVAMLEPLGNVKSSRVLTDHLSGRTDRVVMEIESESIGTIESDMASAMADAALLKRFEDSFGRLTELISKAEVDYWSIQ